MKSYTVDCSSEASIIKRQAGRAEYSIPPDRHQTVRIQTIRTKEEKHGLLDRIESPSDPQAFMPTELVGLSREICEFLVSSVSRVGGHLGPNLGVVELIIVLHQVFESPKDTLVFDTGHQSYVHKMFAGHKDLTRLCETGDLSGYPSHEKSIHDILEPSHTSSLIAWADGISMERRRQGEDSWTTVTISGGALTGGMTWEGFNHPAASRDRCVLIIVNGNERSYALTIGRLALHSDAPGTSESYEHAPSRGKRQPLPLGEPGRAVFGASCAVKAGLKGALAPQVTFKDLDLKYLGPVDGHDVIVLENELMLVKTQYSPVVLHAITQGGRDYTPAGEDIADRFHTVDPTYPETGLPVTPARLNWTSAFTEETIRTARESSKVMGITATMMEPVGLTPMKREFPERVMDVDITEQETLASAAGVAYEGACPVVALYATFLNRVLDQLLMDVTLHQTGVTIVLDRAGVTKVSSVSHNGMWDIVVCRIIPELGLYVPRGEASLRRSFRLTIAAEDRPTVVCYPKGSLSETMSAPRAVGGIDVPSEPGPGTADVLLVTTGVPIPSGLKMVCILEEQGIQIRVVDPIRVLPLREGLLECTKNADPVVTIENGLVGDGFGQAPCDKCVRTRVLAFGIVKTFLGHGNRPDTLVALSLDPESIAQRVRKDLGDAWTG